MGQNPLILSSNRFNKAIKYSGIAIQMAVTIALCNAIGKWAAERFGQEWLISALTLFGIFGAMALVIVQVIRDQKDSE